MSLDVSLKKLCDRPFKVEASGDSPEANQAGVTFTFDNGILLHASYWRLIEDNYQTFSSFDHRQQYGLPEPIDSIEQLIIALRDKVVVRAKHDPSTGDLILEFAQDNWLQILNVTAYEIWTISFPDGTAEHSNYNR